MPLWLQAHGCLLVGPGDAKSMCGPGAAQLMCGPGVAQLMCGPGVAQRAYGCPHCVAVICCMCVCPFLPSPSCLFVVSVCHCGFGPGVAHAGLGLVLPSINIITMLPVCPIFGILWYPE